MGKQFSVCLHAPVSPANITAGIQGVPLQIESVFQRSDGYYLIFPVYSGINGAPTDLNTPFLTV